MTHPPYAFLRVGDPANPGDRSRETLVAYDAICAMIPEPSDDGFGIKGTILRLRDGKQVRVPGETPEQVVTRMLSALHEHNGNEAAADAAAQRPAIPRPSVPDLPVSPAVEPSAAGRPAPLPGERSLGHDPALDL